MDSRKVSLPPVNLALALVRTIDNPQATHPPQPPSSLQLLPPLQHLLEMKASLAIPERIGQGQSLISLLEASAYAPDGDFSSDSEDEDSSEEPTPHSSDPELPSFSHHVYEPENKDHNANPSRGSHINISSVNELERVKKLVREREDLVKELTLDSMERCVVLGAWGELVANEETGG